MDHDSRWFEAQDEAEGGLVHDGVGRREDGSCQNGRESRSTCFEHRRQLNHDHQACPREKS